MPRDEHGHFVKEKSQPKSEPPPQKSAPAKASGWHYHGAVRDARAAHYVHRWTIEDPTGAPLVFTIGTLTPNASEADVIKEHKARLAG
jgi:hypothetical protein